MVRVDRVIVDRFEARTASLPSRTYAAPHRLVRGGRVDPSRLEDRLVRLGYRRLDEPPRSPGGFSRRDGRWIIYLNSALFPDGEREALPVELRIEGGRVAAISDGVTGTALEVVELEPEPLFTSYGDVMEERRWTELEDVPAHLIRAVEIVEDARFERHGGIDPVGIVRAALANLRAGEVVQGGSTITQQLAKNLYDPGPRSVRRKLTEAVAAILLELHYDKRAILEAYLNEVYLGQSGPVAISGVGDAARFLFGTPASELDLARSALIAGMIRNPGGYNPRRHPEAASERRDLVLELMFERGAIGEPAMRTAMAEPLGVIDPPPTLGRLQWIEPFLGAEIEARGVEMALSSAGHSVFTTFDGQVQLAAQEALSEGLARLEERLGVGTDPPLEGAVVVLRPVDGGLLAIVGGRDYGRSQFNRATRALRPPGSTFKPFVYLAGFERSLRDPGFAMTAATVLDDIPLDLYLREGGIWRPHNFDGRFHGRVTVREALEQSINVATVRAAMAIGLPAVADMARRCGISRELEEVPAMALGADAVTPLDLATAYATLAGGGWRARPHGLVCIVDREGRRHGRSATGAVQVVDPGPVFIVTDILVGAVERGTARSARALGLAGIAAGKTGSSDDLRDAWFVGYTPDLLALVWVGYDDNRPVGLSGAQAALPIWVDLMRRIGADGGDGFERPDDVVEVRVDPTTGLRATPSCPHVRDEIFVRGTEPRKLCDVHARQPRKGFWKRLFGAGDH